MQTHKNVIYIFAGSQTSVINNIFLNKENAFFNFATLMNIDVLEKESTLKFLNTLNIDDKTFSKDAIDKLYETTNFHPFYLVKTVQESYIKALLDKSDTVELNHLEDGIKKICEDNNAYFESIWQKINHTKYKDLFLKGKMKN